MDTSPKRKCSGCKQTLSAANFPRKEIRRKDTPAAVNPGEGIDNPSVRGLTCERRELEIDERQNGLRGRRKLRLPTWLPCLLLGRALGARNINQVGQQDGEPPPVRQQRLSTVPTETAGATEAEETPAIDLAFLPSRASVRQQNRRPPRRQTAAPQIGQENVAGPENIAPRLDTVRRARQSRAQTNANRAASEGRRTAAVEETLAAAVRTAEGIARQASERANPALAAAEAEVEAARRAMRASEETRRAAALQESMAAAAAAQAKAEAARLAARDWRLPVYRPRFGPISTVQSRS
ncbi:hypothetical protein E4U17_004442 [Claviceps sp. LM77 group G4]|nr:hypothetical protein E4U17_004442 [Claviceps sp. LM77 group G4]KAG6083532.1 hypothetical protein E4U33_004667 [Claviceps sp. LM78 group G4]